MTTFHEKISNVEIGAIRRVMMDCQLQMRATLSCHTVVGELNAILMDVEDRPNSAEADECGGNNARLQCKQKWDDNLSEPLSKLFTPNRAHVATHA